MSSRVREVNVQGYSYMRAGRLITVPPHVRRIVQIFSDYEHVRLHFRADYTRGRKGHYFEMQDSYVELDVPTGLTDSQVNDRLQEIFDEAFSQEFGRPLLNDADVSFVSGVERNAAGGSQQVVFNYKHSARSPPKSITKSVSGVAATREDRERFFELMKRRPKTFVGDITFKTKNRRKQK